MTTLIPPARSLAKLRALLAGLEREVADAKPRLRALLLNGDSTAGARAAANTAAMRILAIGAEIAAAEGSAARARQSKILDDAATIARATMARIDAGLAALQPPPHPSPSVEH
jgi:hypothetical protein